MCVAHPLSQQHLVLLSSSALYGNTGSDWSFLLTLTLAHTAHCSNSHYGNSHAEKSGTPQQG